MARNLIPAGSGPSMVLQLKADQKQRVRVFNDDPCDFIWRHVWKDGRAFIKVLCTKMTPEGCPYCEINRWEKYIDLPNGERPYPVGTELVKLVYVYEPVNAVKFVVGTEIWKGVQSINAEKEILDRDLVITRSDSGRTSYNVVDKDPSKFEIKLDPTKFPTMDEYRDWLLKNRSRVPLMKPDGTMENVGTTTTTGSGEEPQSGKSSLIPSNPPVAAGPKVMHSPATAAKLNQMFQRLGFNHQVLSQMMKKVDAEKGKVNEFNDGEVERLIVEYELAMQNLT